MLAALALLASLLPSQELLAIDGLLGDVYTIDCKSGLAQYQGSTGLNYWIWTAMSKDSNDRIIAAYYDYRTLSGTDLYEIDPVTSQASFIVSTPLIAIAGLAFDSNDQLYAAHERSPGVPYSPEDLYLIDLVSGASTFIGPIGTTVLTNLAYGKGRLWCYDGVLGLVEIDPVTGVGVDSNPSFRGHLALAEELCFGPGEELYLLDAGLWIMDTNSGVPALAGLTQYQGYFTAVAFLNGPASPFTLGTIGLSGGPMGLEAWGASPNTAVAFVRANSGGGPTPIPSGSPCAGTLLDLNSSLRLAVVATTDSQGHARLGPVSVPAAAAGSLRLQALDLATCRTSNLARVIY